MNPDGHVLITYCALIPSILHSRFVSVLLIALFHSIANHTLTRVEHVARDTSPVFTFAIYNRVNLRVTNLRVLSKQRNSLFPIFQNDFNLKISLSFLTRIKII